MILCDLAGCANPRDSGLPSLDDRLSEKHEILDLVPIGMPIESGSASPNVDYSA